MKTFYITTDYIELIRLLKACGPYQSEAEAKQSITDGLVTVNGEVETRRKCKLIPGQVVVAGETEITISFGR